MKQDAKGAVIHEAAMTVQPVKVAELASAIGTDSAAETAALVLWFGPTVAGDARLVEVLDLDFSRALLAGHTYEWARPFRPGEQIQARLVVDDVYTKGDNQFAVVKAEFRDAGGDVVQSQRTTFIERGA